MVHKHNKFSDFTLFGSQTAFYAAFYFPGCLSLSAEVAAHIKYADRKVCDI